MGRPSRFAVQCRVVFAGLHGMLQADYDAMLHAEDKTRATTHTCCLSISLLALCHDVGDFPRAAGWVHGVHFS